MRALGTMRPPFLTLTRACMLLGVATARLAGHAILWLDLALALIGGVAAHVAVNALNEWDDFRSGLDAHTERTPFSGGSGTLPAAPELARSALHIGVAGLCVTLAVGLFFVVKWGLALVPLGLLGLLTVVLYTRWLTRSSLLCLLAPGLGFGPCMVMGTHFVIAGAYSTAAFLASLVPLFLVSNLLLLNQYPDQDADRAAGRRHLIIAHGPAAGIRVFGLFMVGAYAAVLIGVLTERLPLPGLLALLTIPLALIVYLGLRRLHATIPALVPVMGRNVLHTHLMPLLLAIGIFLGAR